MRKKYLVVIILLLFVRYQSKAQITLNPAVDTVHSLENRGAIHTLSTYLNARLHNQDGKAFWLPSEAGALKNYDLYEAHNLYQISFDEIIVLGITSPEKKLFKIKVLFSYMGTDKVRTIWSVNDFYLKKQDDTFKLTNALYNNMRFSNYRSVTSNRINYHFPPDYKYQQSKIDSANNFLHALEQFFNKPLPPKIEYVTAPTCENLYSVLGASFQAAILSSSTTFCGYFDMDNLLIITSGGEYYKHELLRTLNLMYPNAPDLLKSGITCLWGGTANKPAIYHLKKLYPYLLKHPEVLEKLEDFYYFDDETNPQFIFQTIVINYVLKHEGKPGLLKLMQSLSAEVTTTDFLKQHFQITDPRSFFLNEFKYYNAQNRLEFDNIFDIK
jgi:hypothetical protein